MNFNPGTKKIEIKDKSGYALHDGYGTGVYFEIEIYRPVVENGVVVSKQQLVDLPINAPQSINNVDTSQLENYTYQEGDIIKFFHQEPNKLKFPGVDVLEEKIDYYI